MTTKPKTFLDLVNDCDRLPYENSYDGLWHFSLPNDPRSHGLILPSTIEQMPWTDDFIIDRESRKVILQPKETGDLSKTCTVALSKQIQRIIDENTFKVISGRHSEPYPIMGSNFPVSLERYASTLFGIISRGAHLTAYTTTADGLKIWVPRRSAHLFTYPNCLDTTVAGGIAAGEGPFECILRESEEEASFPEEFVRNKAVACGCISYIGLNDVRGGGETGLISPDLIYVYDLELAEDVVPKQNDEEVQEFILMSIKEVKEALGKAEFKTNSALVMIDFFVRHGVITAENEASYAEIVARLHRRLPLPTCAE